MLAYFGWPQAHEDEAERAVRSGLAMIEALAELETPAGEPLAARVGIATGLVMVGELIGEGAAQEQAVVGETPNLAARLQALAEPGSVVISQAHTPARGRAVRAHRSRSARGSKASPSRSLPGGSKAKVVPKAASKPCTASGSRRWSGASTSWRILLERWAWAKDGDGQVVLLVGRARDRQVAPDPGAARAPRRRAVHAAQLLLLALPHQQRASPGDRAAGAGGAARSRRPAGAAARQARGGARPARATGWTRSCRCSRRCSAIPTGTRYPRADPDPGDAEAANVAGAASTSSRASRRSSRCWRSTRTCTGSTRRRSSSWAWWSSASAQLPVLVVVTFRPEFQPPWTGQAHVTALTMSRLGRRQGAA